MKGLTPSKDVWLAALNGALASQADKGLMADPRARYAIEIANAVCRQLDQRKPEQDLQLPPTVLGVDFHVVDTGGGGWIMEAGHDVEGGPFAPDCVRQGSEREEKNDAAIDAWSLALSIALDRVATLEREVAELSAAVEVGHG
jgi:hypothetical protein